MTLSTSNITLPLDLQKIFVNYFSGSIGMFMIIALIFFTALAAFFRMPSAVFGLIIAIFCFAMAKFYPIFMAPAIVISALFIGYIIYKTIK